MATKQRQRQPMVSLESSEILRVLRTAKAHGVREWAMFLLGFRHGLRASEITALRLDDVNLRDGSIRIERLKGSLQTVQALADHRGEPLLSELKALRQWLSQRQNDGSDYLFTSAKGGRLSRVQVFRLFASIATEAGLPPEKAHPHTLKHSLATGLVAANVNLAIIKQALGHRSINSTMRYISVSDRDASKATAVAMMKLF